MARRLPLLVILALASGACWEQVAPEWFGAMKEQPAVQALEDHRPFEPPEGTIPRGGLVRTSAKPHTGQRVSVWETGFIAPPVPTTA